MRVVLGGILGGVAIFFGGFIGHMLLDLEARAFKEFPDRGVAMQAAVDAQKLEHGIYRFPGWDKEAAKNDQQATFDALNVVYKKGPNGMIIVGRKGEDMMTARELGGECASNVAFALLAAWIVSQLHANAGFCSRWLTVFFIGVAAWLSISVSMGLWYRFDWQFVLDQLYCCAIESALGGIVIAGIVKPKRSF